MFLVEFEDDWAALYGDDNVKLTEGHTGDVRLAALELSGVGRRSATRGEEEIVMHYGAARAETRRDV